ncbi:MAG: hypothetical protein K2G83_01120, partial [Ruminococcus sp.]|nr:hypothetical protein [Ruminococcus sp.]
HDEVTSNMIMNFIEYLRKGNDSEKIIALHKENAGTNATINRILSTVHTFIATMQLWETLKIR